MSIPSGTEAQPPLAYPPEPLHLPVALGPDAFGRHRGTAAYCTIPVPVTPAQLAMLRVRVRRWRRGQWVGSLDVVATLPDFGLTPLTTERSMPLRGRKGFRWMMSAKWGGGGGSHLCFRLELRENMRFGCCHLRFAFSSTFRGCAREYFHPRVHYVLLLGVGRTTHGFPPAAFFSLLVVRTAMTFNPSSAS